MFTGLVEALGNVRQLTYTGPGARLVVEEASIAATLKIGDSVAVNGVCLTVVARDSEAFTFEMGPETLARTNLGDLEPMSRVNLERALAVGDRLGGHFVQGHVDGVGTISERRRDGEWEFVRFQLPPDLARYLVGKGSISVDGVSLTVVEANSTDFSVMLIPHTLAATTLGFKKIGAKVNLETDLIAKHLVRYLDVLDLSSRLR